MNKKTEEVSEIVIPKGYDIDDILDMSDDFGNEEPIYTKEVKIHFE